jgi:hypothetical protein
VGVYNVWLCVCVGVLETCVLVFTLFGVVSFMYIYSYLLLVNGLLLPPPTENSIAVNNNNNNNNNNVFHTDVRQFSTS